ncbi:TonB-dependent receptor domain-containing protein [Sphingomonas sp. SUN039]|uniref:TonB-dependent receptor domain-containing protein n=1 Tax=Sphingomonas sp. SUN039 TaxID=2937787 RepID=UPI002164B48A|nr:TonB-dependent receptor [Sphingomonas sp. SUN039]UVO54071.1 TonB-dependent receptor [Sphingomonas sp. SUN039]
MNVVRFLSATALAGAALALPGFALAQGTAPTAEQCKDNPQLANCPTTNADGSESTSSTIVVTGSRIARPTLSSPVPVTSVSAEDILSSGDLNVGDALNDLPSLRSTFSQSNSTRFIGTAGLNELDLRGLGVARTLVLVNGRRHVTVAPGSYIVDVNTIPGELLERVDVVTGGNSAIYGSDAIAGVVNFVLKRNFDGFRISGQSGVSQRGDRGSYFVAGTFGRNFADGRGNIAVSAEYSKQNPIKFVGRDYLTGAFSGRNQFNTNEPTAGEPQSGDGIPDQVYLTGVRNGNISDGGLITGVCNSTLLTNSTRCAVGATTALPLAQMYVFQPDGTLIVNPVIRDLRVETGNATSNTVGGLGSTLSNYGDLFPELERFTVNVLARFEVSDAFQPFVEAKYNRLKVISETSPSFFQGSIPGFFGGGANLRCDNPYLTQQAFNQLVTIGRCPTGVAFGATNAATFNLTGRNNVDLGSRGEFNTRDTFRIVAGIEGRFNDDWRYEIAVNYGQLISNTTSTNNLLLFKPDGSNAGFLNAIDATRNAAGQIVCRINAVTVTDPACVPYNPFGSGASTNLEAVRNYVNVNSQFRDTASELVISANLGGDLSQLFELPGGPIGFAIGGEYREERASRAVDDNTSLGLTFLTALQGVNYPKLTVKDIYGEVRVPILRDTPGFQLLEFNGAYRYSEYNTNAGGTHAYNASVVYSPIADLKFRAAYARSVRTPTQANLFAPVGQNFASISDPCDVLFINSGSATRAANCAAAGIPVGFVNTAARAATLSFSQGGNPFLTAEKSDSYTLGAVLEPRFVPGLSITVDYYNIKVSNLIATLGANTIINLCYDSPTLNNQYCPLVNRVAGGNFGPRAVLSGPVNFARQVAKGIDIDLAYSKKFENGDRFAYRVIAGWKLAIDNFVDPTNPLIPDRQLSELGDPQFEFSASTSYKHGPVEGRLAVRYIGPQTIGTYEAQNPYYGLCPTATNAAAGVTAGQGLRGACTAGSIVLLQPQNADQTAEVYYPSQVYADVRFSLDVTKKFRLSVGIDNLFDRKPPLGLLGTGAGSGIFDATGRYFYAAFRADL